MGTTQRMARFIESAKYEDIPAPAVNLAKLCLLDAVGCAIYGTTRPLGKIMTSLVDELGGKPVARVLGTRIETNSVNAAMANGTLGHSEDFDDFGAGHQAVLKPAQVDSALNALMDLDKARDVRSIVDTLILPR